MVNKLLLSNSIKIWLSLFTSSKKRSYISALWHLWNNQYKKSNTIKWQSIEGEAQGVGTLDPYIYSNLSSSLIITGHL